MWQDDDMDEDDLTPEQQELLKQIRARRVKVMAEHRLKKSTANNKAVLPRRADPNRASTTGNMKVWGFSPGSQYLPGKYASCHAFVHDLQQSV
jgi:hypothetical protein